MRADFTRLIHNGRNYVRVLLQQGRVQLDADADEAAAIDAYLAQKLVADLIGPHGAPRAGAGFAIAIERDGDGATGLVIGAGRYCVDGLLCTNVATVRQAADDPPEPPFLVYLDVWQRQVTAIEGPSVREPAIDGVDTTTRLATAWRVRTTAADLPPAHEPAHAVPATCDGYSGVENRLYRVEVHDGGDIDDATFKWSRDNPSSLPLLAVTGAQVTRPDFTGVSKPAPAEDGRVDLEDGVAVVFTVGCFRSGDYWLLPARADDGTVAWPVDGDGPIPLPPIGVHHHHAPLARVDRDGSVVDLRRLLDANRDRPSLLSGSEAL